MLIEYAFLNFRSFADRTTLSMKAGAQTTLNNNLIRRDRKRYLPSAVIYGPNASGKSNVIMSLSLMREIVLQGGIDGNAPELTELEICPFAYNAASKPMGFDIAFENGGRCFQYALMIEVEPFSSREKRRIVSEMLAMSNGKRLIPLFMRDESKVSFQRTKPVFDDMLGGNEKLLNELEERINKNLDPTRLFLTNAFKSIINSEIADAVIGFFRDQLFVVSDFTLKRTKFMLSMEKKLPDADFVAWNRMLDVFVKSADFGPQKIMFRSKKTDDTHTAPMHLVSLYDVGGKQVMLPADIMESRGTIKLVDFAIHFVERFAKGGVFVIDEFDSAIHPELVKGIIALFNDPNVNKEGAQLVFTTHNPIYLNNKMFRRDQILFVEKDRDSYRSVLYSLADFGSADVRNDQNYLINYFKGKYGALPYIDFAGLLKQPSGEEKP